MLLEEALRKKRQLCMIGTGSMCDPYLHLEEQLRLTRRCLEIIEKYGFGLSILTKSDRILRDVDLLCRIQENAKCVVQMTLTTYDEKPHFRTARLHHQAAVSCAESHAEPAYSHGCLALADSPLPQRYGTKFAWHSGILL